MNKSSKSIFAAVLLGTVCLPVYARGTVQYSNAELKGDALIRFLKQEALAGQADQQARLGLMLMQKGLYAEAVQWNNIAASNGSKLGKKNMAIHFKYGLAVRKSPEKAMELFQNSKG